jgi:hypothetical protein
LELGIHMVQELRLQRSNDTLSRWMVHHLAELMTAAEKAVSPEEQTKATEAAANLILKVWEHRANLPGGVNPMNSFSGVLRVLNHLNARDNPWADRPGTPYQVLGAKIYRELKRITVGLLLVDTLPAIRQVSAGKKNITQFLSHDERAILLGLGSWPRIVFATQGQKEKTADSEVIDALRGLTDTALSTLTEIRKRLGADPRLGKSVASNRGSKPRRKSKG